MSRLKNSKSRTFMGLLGIAALCAGIAWSSAYEPVLAAAPAIVLVDGGDGTPDFGGCGNASNPCNTVQAGVDNANAKDTVSVAAGTYTEQVVINKNLTLDGVNGAAIIKAPALMDPSATIVTVNGGATVTVSNLTISGPGGSTCGSIAFGISVLGGAHANILHNTITDIRNDPASGCQFGVGILVGRASAGEMGTASIHDNQILNFQKGGIVVDRQGSFADIRENVIDGFGPVPFIAQNGIQVSRGAGGHVRDNEVNGSWYTGANWTSTGILIFESSGVIVQRNHLDGNQTGISAEAWCWSTGPYVALPANNNIIEGNTVEGSEWGIVVYAVDFAGYSGCDPSANNNKVVNNVITSPGTGQEGVFVGAYDAGPFAPEAVNNKVVNNTISGFATPVATQDDTASKVHANRPAN